MSEVEGLLRRVVEILDRSGVPFMIAGSFASTAHGLPRATQDLDVVIDPPNADALQLMLRALPADSYYADGEAALDAFGRRSMFNVIDLATGWKIDFIVRKNRPFSRAEFDRRLAMDLLGVAVHVASAEDTVVAKIEWSKQSGGSERQRRDVAGILATMGDELDRGYVERWVVALNLADEWAAAQATSIA